MKKILGAVYLIFYCVASAYGVEIIEDEFAGVPHFIIKTKNATYYLDKAGGGLSRMVDTYGNDWINFKRSPWDEYPESAAASFRGLPNLIFGSDESGVGHAGYDKCYSFKVDERTILTISKSGMWQWRWHFNEHYASITIEKTDPNHRYWFLYEGPIAGEFRLDQQYWGTNLGGPRRDMNDYYNQGMIYANWHWIYFGDNRVKQVLFVAMKQPDRQIDALGFLGNSAEGVHSEEGMVVFGFGRQSDARPLMSDPHNTFYFGFLKTKVKSQGSHDSVDKEIQNILK